MSIEQGQLFRHDFGPRQDHLQEGPRPVVVVQSDAINRIENYANVIVVPLTTKGRPSATYIPVQPGSENKLDGTSWAITNQIFTLDKTTLNSPIGRVSKSEMDEIKQGLKIALGIG